MKNWREIYEELPQKKQRFHVAPFGHEYHVEIEVKPYPVKTKSGQDGGFLTVANVYDESGWGTRGETVCIPTDNFDFAYGARLALDRALNCRYSQTQISLEGYRTVNMFMAGTTKNAIWKEFVKIFPK